MAKTVPFCALHESRNQTAEYKKPNCFKLSHTFYISEDRSSASVDRQWIKNKTAGSAMAISSSGTNLLT